MTKAEIKSTGKIVKVTSRFMPKKRNAPSREWMCNLSDGTCINESELEYLKDSLQNELDKKAAEKDLALTWKDMKRISRILDIMVDDDFNGKIPEEWREEEYYEEVLRRFIKQRR